MTVVRSKILPPGFYWYDDIAKPGRPADFTTWRNGQKGLVNIISTAIHKDENPPRQWVLFEVKFPALWDQRLGFPNIAEKGKDTNEQDTTTNTPGATPGPGLFDGLDLSTLFSGGTGVLLLGGLLYALSNER
jgi:hypothetical protein